MAGTLGAESWTAEDQKLLARYCEQYAIDHPGVEMKPRTLEHESLFDLETNQGLETSPSQNLSPAR